MTLFWSLETAKPVHNGRPGRTTDEGKDNLKAVQNLGMPGEREQPLVVFLQFLGNISSHPERETADSILPSSVAQNWGRP